MKKRLMVFVGVLALVTVASMGMSKCAGKNAPVLVGQIGLASSQSIERISNLSRDLRVAGSLPVASDVRVQQTLKSINSKLEPLPDILRSIDRLQTANSPTADLTTKAIAILEEVGQDVSVVLAGVPITAATEELVKLIRAAQGTIQQTLVAVAKIQGGTK